MPIRHVKDKSRLIDRRKVAPRHARPHYWFVYLWADRESMLQNAENGNPSTQALHCCNPTRIRIEDGEEEFNPLPLVGEMHFVTGEWDSEVAFHETMHGVLHFYRVHGRGGDYFEKILGQDDDMVHEEALCYLAGELGRMAYAALWQMDPALKVSRETRKDGTR